MKQKVSLILGAGAAVFLMTGVALAQPGHGGKGPFDWKKADTNGDGSISFDEFQAQHQKLLERRFQRMDKDGNGLISAEEMEGARARMRERWQQHRGMQGAGPRDSYPSDRPADEPPMD